MAVNQFNNNPIKASEVTKIIWIAAKVEQKRNSNIRLQTFGTHSIRSGTTLAIYLAGTSIVYSIL